MVNGYPINKNRRKEYKDIVWSYGIEYGDSFEEFEDPVRRVHINERPNREKVALPMCLTGNKNSKQCEEIEFIFSQMAGKYTFYMDVKEAIKSNFIAVYLDGREIGCFGVPFVGNADQESRYNPLLSIWLEKDKQELENITKRYRINERYDVLKDTIKTYCFEIPFILVDTGSHKLTIKNLSSKLNDEIYLFVGEGITCLNYALVQGIESRVNLPRAENFMDLWGWMSMTSFDHPAHAVTQPERLYQRSIKESFKWGANNLEFLPVNEDGMALDLTTGDDWVGQQNYIQSKDKVWSSEEVRYLIQLAHEYGMLTEFFIFSLFGAEFLRNPMDFEEKINLYGKIAENYSNLLEVENMSMAVDGIITEAWFPIDGPRYSKAASVWNPSFFTLVSVHSGEQIDIINAGYSPSVHHYIAHWPTFSVQHTGFDHCYPILPYPQSFYEKPEGTIYTYMQGCGQTHHLRKNYPRIIPDLAIGITNRTVSPDWIIAQAHSFALNRFNNPNNFLATALCWEADEETMAPPEARRYIYAASQDPIRLAAAYRLEDTGTGGQIQLKKNTRRVHKEDITKLRERHHLPSGTTVIQNRFLQLALIENSDYNGLFYDMGESATFYNQGELIEIAMPFCITRFNDNRHLRLKTEILEAAGPKSVVRQTSRLGSGYVTLEQCHTITTYSEQSLIINEFERSILPGQTEEITTFLGFMQYECIYIKEVNAHSYHVFLKCKMQLFPDLFIHIEGSMLEVQKIYFELGKGLYIVQKLELHHYLKVVTKIRSQEEAHLLEEILFSKMIQPEVCIKLVETSVEVNNSEPVDVIKCIKVDNPDEAPYFIQEGEWWKFKGATPSQQYPGRDYLRLTISGKGRSKIQRYGFIEDSLRADYGCQYLLNFKSIEVNEGTVEFVVRINAVTPMIPAPRIRFKQNIGEVYLNGKKWHYYHLNCMMLPNIKAEYTVKVHFGLHRSPVILSSFGTIIQTYHDEQSFAFTLRHPEWVNDQQQHIPYHVIIQLGDFQFNHMDNGQILRKYKDRILIETYGGTVSIS
jgi:hypothetical protein